MEDIEFCSTCGIDLSSVSIHIIDGNEYHVCSYNDNDADFDMVEFEQIPFGDRLNFGFSQAIWPIDM